MENALSDKNGRRSILGDYNGETKRIKANSDGSLVSGLTEQKQIVDEVSIDLVYIGFATFGSATSASVWKIQRISTSGNITTIEYADGNTTYDNIWDDRASLFYS